MKWACSRARSDCQVGPGAELGAEAGKAEDDLSVRVLREHLLDRVRQVVGGGAGGYRLDHEGEHLFAECVLDRRQLVGPGTSDDLVEPFYLGCDAPLTTGPPGSPPAGPSLTTD